MACPLLAWEKAKDIEGWYDREEAIMLSILCEGQWCEVGAWKGRSTVMLAETGHKGWVVDHFKGSPEHAVGTDTFDEFAENTRGYGLNVVVDRLEEAAQSVPRHLYLLHLDGDHSYESTKRAFELYSPKVREHGYLAFHDAAGGAWPEVERFVAEIPEGWQHFATVQRLVVFRRA